MSTSTETAIPQEEEVVARQGSKAWRIANGTICRGSKDSSNLETRDKIVGRLRRVGIYDGKYEDERIYQVEADIETASGMVRVKSSLTDMQGKETASGVSIGLTWGLLQIAKDEDMIITATQGSTKNKFGSYPTFVNIFRLPAGSKTGTEVPRRKKVDEPMEDTLQKLLDELREHPAYADRPASEAKGDTHLGELTKEAAAKGWPTPEQAPDEWLQMTAKFFKLKAPKAALSDHDDDEWGQVRLSLQVITKLPALLEAAKKRLEEAEDDPFA